MSSLKLVASQSQDGVNVVAKAPGDRRGVPDRRASERRNYNYHFESRDSRLRFAAQAAGFGTYDLDCTTGDSAWSPELRAMAGLPPDNGPLSSEQVEALIHPEDRQRFLDRFWASLNPRGSGEFEDDHRLLRPDGKICWVKTKGRAFFVGQDETRRPFAATGVVMDITASRLAEQKYREQSEEALRRSKEDLELAVRGANIGTWHWDLTDGKAELSERCRQLFGIAAEGPLNYRHVVAAVHPDDRGIMETALRRTLEEGAEYKVEKRFVWPDGSIHWMECIGRELCMEEEGGKPVGMRGISIDITERKRQEEALLHSKETLEACVEERTAELRRANEALERSNLELQQFAFIAAHDLQTPLRSITGFAQLLEKDFHGQLGPVADTWLDQLVRSAHRMRDVIHDVLAYSRVDSRGGAFQPVDFNQLFDDVLATLDAPIREAGARVVRGELPTVEGDRTQLAQVLQNLIENAIKYRSEEVPRIFVSAARQDGEWVFSVRDNGIGIPEKHLEQIFDIFRRLHTSQEFPGTGIGLAICRRVVHRHRGRIWAESQPGQGSIFHFTLPERQ